MTSPRRFCSGKYEIPSRRSCASASACTAVGDYNNGTTGVTLAERWTGTTWSIQHTPNPTGAPVSLLNGVSCASVTVCTAVSGYNNGTVGVTLAERWGGWASRGQTGRVGRAWRNLGRSPNPVLPQSGPAGRETLRSLTTRLREGSSRA